MWTFLGVYWKRRGAEEEENTPRLRSMEIELDFSAEDRDGSTAVLRSDDLYWGSRSHGWHGMAPNLRLATAYYMKYSFPDVGSLWDFSIRTENGSC